MVGRHAVVDRPHPCAHSFRRIDPHGAAGVTATSDEPSAVDIEVDAAIVVRDRLA